MGKRPRRTARHRDRQSPHLRPAPQFRPPHITTVDLGDGQPVQIVCGAPNVAAGQTVPVATVGAVLYDKDGSEFKIKESKLRGEVSLGMICAEDELGLGESHDGIMVLPDDIPAGTPAAEVSTWKPTPYLK